MTDLVGQTLSRLGKSESIEWSMYESVELLGSYGFDGAGSIKNPNMVSKAVIRSVMHRHAKRYMFTCSLTAHYNSYANAGAYFSFIFH